MATADGPDLVVAGAGGGLVGALRAAERGRSVLVVEASEHFTRGNNTAMSTAMVPGAGTRMQATAGVVDSPARFVADVMARTDGQADPSVAGALASVSARLVHWLADTVGLPVALAADADYPGHTVPRCHTVPGRSGARLLAALAAAVRRDPRIDLLVPARLVDARPDGRGIGAVVEYPDGTRERVDAGALLLATNGFGADRDLVATHIPEIAGAAYHGSSQSRGDALRIGTALGADAAYLDAYQGHGALAAAAGTLLGWATVIHGGIVVNAAGRRFGDETQGYSEFARLELRQPGGEAVVVFDRRVHDACLAFDDFARTVEAGALRWADTLAELAAAVGVDPHGLAATLDQAARSAAGRAPDPFGRHGWGGGPLRPPYAAVRVRPALFHTQGGLRVDGHARVLRPDGSAIPALYAAGGAAAGISGHGPDGYLAGNGLLSALGLSFLAAEHLCGYG